MNELLAGPLLCKQQLHETGFDSRGRCAQYRSSTVPRKLQRCSRPAPPQIPLESAVPQDPLPCATAAVGPCVTCSHLFESAVFPCLSGCFQEISKVGHPTEISPQRQKTYASLTLPTLNVTVHPTTPLFFEKIAARPATIPHATRRQGGQPA